MTRRSTDPTPRGVGVPRVVRLPRRPALIVLPALLVALPATLSACGLLEDRSNKNDRPVVIPTETPDPAAAAPSLITIVPTASTVIKTGLVVRSRTSTVTVTVKVTAAPVTKTVQLPGGTKTITKTITRKS
jgi:hypothetical protein